MSALNKQRVAPLHSFNIQLLEKLNRPIIPLKPRAKTPITKKFQTLPPSSAYQIEKLINQYKGWNLAVVCGDGLFVMDFDVEKDYHEFRSKYPGIKTMVVKTGNGFHVYFRSIQNTVGNNHFYLPMHDQKSGEFRAQGGYVVAPGCKHESGKIYTVIEGSPEEIQTVEPAFLTQFLKENAWPKESSSGSTSKQFTLSKEWNESELLAAKMNLPNKTLTLNQKWSLIKKYKKDHLFTHRTKGESRHPVDMSCAHTAINFGITEEEFKELANRYPAGMGNKYSECGEGYIILTYRKALLNHNFGRLDKSKANTAPVVPIKSNSSGSSYNQKQEQKNEDRVMNLFHHKGNVISLRDITNSRCLVNNGGPDRSVKKAKMVVGRLIEKGMVAYDTIGSSASETYIRLI